MTDSDIQVAKHMDPDHTVLVVDLDDALVATDTLLESVFLFLKAHFLQAFLMLAWLLKGKGHFKDQLARRVRLDVATLPYRNDVLKILENARSQGRKTVLATAANYRIADDVANHLGLFSQVLASDASINLSGFRKRDAVLLAVDGEPFTYIGDSMADIPLWQAAATAIMVDPSSRVLRQMGAHPDARTIRSRNNRNRLSHWLNALRLHQWAKNFLLFVPAIMAHRLHEPGIFLNLAMAFLSLGFTASAIYMVNDLLDLEADRQHFKKKFRPLAAGDFSVRRAVFTIPTLLVIGFGLSVSMLPGAFSFGLLFFVVLTILYSLVFKKRIIIDVILLATLYTFRVIVGAIAVNILVSSWLLAFSMFFFLSLALMKRYSELLLMKTENGQIPGRGYVKLDSETTRSAGISSGQISLLVLALYMNSESVRQLYGEPMLLWIVLPLLFYWITRMWMITHRGDMHEDPIVYTIKDPASYVVFSLILLVILASSQHFGDLLPVRFLVP